MRIVKKVVLGVLVLVAVLVLVLISVGLLRWDKTVSAPMPQISASTDASVIARGKYLVWGPAHCAGCHGDVDKIAQYEETGEEIPLSGGLQMEIDPGIIRPSNITSDEETGIGAMSDGEIARALRYGVSRDSTTLFPMMPFADLSDDDLTAIVSYLRSLPPVKAKRAKTEYNLLGKIIMALAIDPLGPEATPPKSIRASTDASYGEYLALRVANCYGCHTDRDLKTGEFTGKPFAGGLVLPHQGTEYTIPNITPKGQGSRISNQDLAAFEMTMRRGISTVKGSPMPWVSYAEMTDDDIEALYNYLQTIPSVDVDHGPAVKSE